MNTGKLFQDLSNFLFLAEGRLQDPLDKLARRLRNGELKQLECEHNASLAVAEAANKAQADRWVNEAVATGREDTMQWLHELRTALATLNSVRNQQSPTPS